ncbi:MAG: Stk1 family PASTA domain-containing Ser/Thr kinase [Clostridia bacterium]|nr:Stk1 family PASTA domain-containing Ser/Thr kinase [Clostridia bacterium]
MTGRVLNDRYEIIEKVGSGGMADVYRGFDREEQRTVAIKIMKQEYSNDPLYLRRLRLEAQAMVNLKNEHTVALYDMGSEGDVHYLVLEYISGRTLRDRMDEAGRLSPREAVSIACDVLDGLSHAHRMGLIHRDVKPQNIMITDSGVIKLADFGIAKFTGSATKTYSGNEALGSVYYISPEQAKGETVDAQTDIYSVGVMLYEMLSGSVPFNGDNAVQIALKHINEQMKPLKQANESVSVALSDVVGRAAAKDRSIRYASADDLRRDLKKALRYPLSRFARIKGAEVEKSIAPPAEEGKKSFFTRERIAHTAILAGVLGIITVFAVMFIISLHGHDSGYAKVPSFLGYTEQAAAEYAANRGFTLEVAARESSDEYPAGEVCRQDPEAQTKAKPGTVIRVTLSTGNETVTVPDLLGKTVAEARRLLEASGLSLDPHIDYVVDTATPGTVLSQSLNPGETVYAGDSVAITVSSETQATGRMPDLVGRDIAEAAELLAAANITNYRFVPMDQGKGGIDAEDMEVVLQSPEAGTDIPTGLVTAQVYINAEHIGDYKAEFSENVTLSSDSSEIIVTVVSAYGEVELYDQQIDSAGTHSIPFTGRFWERGSFTCILYVNGEVEKTFVRSFE